MKLLTDHVCWCPFLTLPKLTPLIQHLLLFLAFLFLLLGFCQDNKNNKKLVFSRHCNKFHLTPVEVPLFFFSPCTHELFPHFEQRRQKEKEKKKNNRKSRGSREDGEGVACSVQNPPYLRGWPCLACKALSQELAQKIRKQQASPGETGSQLSGELEESIAHTTHTYTIPLLPFCLIVSLWLSLNVWAAPEHGEKALLFLQLLHCQPFPVPLGQTPMCTQEELGDWPGVMGAQPVQTAETDGMSKVLQSTCFSN